MCQQCTAMRIIKQTLRVWLQCRRCCRRRNLGIEKSSDVNILFILRRSNPLIRSIPNCMFLLTVKSGNCSIQREAPQRTTNRYVLWPLAKHRGELLRHTTKRRHATTVRVLLRLEVMVVDCVCACAPCKRQAATFAHLIGRTPQSSCR